MKVIKKESVLLWMSKIKDNLFTCDTPLGMTFDEFNRLSGMDDDLFTYEVGVPGLSYPLYDEPQCDNFENCDLDVYESRWLDLMYGDHRIVDKKIKEEVISKWLIRSYKEHCDEYIEIKKQWMKHGIDADMEYDPSNVDFAE
ncbi:hypothetical protein Tco_0134898 [Tanacetum coccineum]